jgi:hypothetical protein
MATVTVLTSGRLDLRKLERQLAREKYVTAPTADGLRITPIAGSPVDVRLVTDEELPEDLVSRAWEVIGRRPARCLVCVFDGPIGDSPAWASVIGIAQAVAAVMPLAVLDDHAGSTYLIHPARGLIRTGEVKGTRATRSAGALLRRLFRDGS